MYDATRFAFISYLWTFPFSVLFFIFVFFFGLFLFLSRASFTNICLLSITYNHDYHWLLFLYFLAVVTCGSIQFVRPENRAWCGWIIFSFTWNFCVYISFFSFSSFSKFSILINNNNNIISALRWERKDQTIDDVIIIWWKTQLSLCIISNKKRLMIFLFKIQSFVYLLNNWLFCCNVSINNFKLNWPLIIIRILWNRWGPCSFDRHLCNSNINKW